MNEHDSMWFNKEECKVAQDSKTFPFNLTTPQGKSEFENYLNDFSAKVPGAFSAPGTPFDFKSYYASLGV